MPKTLYMSVDCGTSTVKAGLFDGWGRRVSLATTPIHCQFHTDGPVTQDMGEILHAVFRSLRRALADHRVSPGRVAAICIANQRATVLALDRHGEPLQPAISWQDMTGAPALARLRQQMSEADYYQITGLPIHAVFTLAKLLHLKKDAPQEYRRASRFVLVQDYLLRALGCPDYLVDYSNASLTGLLDIRRLRWSPDILRLAGIAGTRLSSLVPSGQSVGGLSPAAARLTGLRAGTPLIMGGGDQQCAGAGAGVVRSGLCSVTMGTAGVSFCHSDRAVFDPQRRITCCAHVVPGCWNLEGLQNAAGDSLRWATRTLLGSERLSKTALAHVAAVPAGSRGVLFLPYLAGASAPHWIAEATGTFLGLRPQHEAACLVRAVMEGVVLESRQILDVFTALRVPIREIRLTGGCSSLSIWDQIQADLYGRTVRSLSDPEATLLGAAMLGAYGVGAFPTLQAAADQMVRIGETFKPDRRQTKRYAAVYQRYVDVVRKFTQNDIFKTVIN
jgi:xylulokinase